MSHAFGALVLAQAAHSTEETLGQLWASFPPARFVSMYVLRAGFLDGAAGVLVAALAAMSVAAKYARLWELQRR